MNKYQLALDTIMDETCHISEVSQPIKVIKELVDKEIPMKLGWNESFCGNCDTIRLVPYNNYCSHCGQRIDWSNDD